MSGPCSKPSGKKAAMCWISSMIRSSESSAASSTPKATRWSYGSRRQDNRTKTTRSLRTRVLVGMMESKNSRITIHMVASLDGFIARPDGSVDWMETQDEFLDGETMEAGFVEAFLKTIDCYVMGSRTYETALSFETKGSGWSYGDKPTFVLTHRELPRTRDTVEFYSGDLAQFVNERLRPKFRSIWFVGGGVVSAECVRLGLADEVRY